VKFLLALLLFAIPLQAQNLPFKPEPTVKVKLTCGDDLACKQKWYTYPDTQKAFYEELPVPHRTADKAFWLVTAVSQAATLADDFNTEYALKRPGTSEANPILRSTPALFGVTEGLFLVNEAFTYRAKREDDALKAAGIPGHKYAKWWVIPIFNIAPHAVGVGATIAFTGR